MSTHGAGAEGGAASEMGDKDDTGLLNNDESDEDGVGSSSQISRDTIVNPYWLEDKGLGRGAVDYLSGAEVSFWKDLIKQYLYPLDANKSQQVNLFDCKINMLIFKRTYHWNNASNFVCFYPQVLFTFRAKYFLVKKCGVKFLTCKTN